MHVSLSFAKVVGSKAQISLKSEWNYSVKSVLHSTEPANYRSSYTAEAKEIADLGLAMYRSAGIIIIIIIVAGSFSIIVFKRISLTYSGVCVVMLTNK
jgi:hypothetical protein